MSKLTVLIPEEQESLAEFAKRITQAEGEILAILSWREKELANDEAKLKKFLSICKGVGGRLRIATKDKDVILAARTNGFRVVESVTDLKRLIKDHTQVEEALRAFNPQVWKQQLRSRLQRIGLLSVPRLRMYILLTVSAILFFFVFFKLLPSAEVRVIPREDTISQTANIFLVVSGATLEIPNRVRTMELWPIQVDLEKTITYDQISKQFIGDSSRVPMTIINNAAESYSLRKGSRLMNQAGMIFRMIDGIVIDPGEEITVRSEADPLDLYGEIIGARGNIPAGLKWKFPGLAKSEQDLVYAENRVPAQGGTTAWREVLAKEDLEMAKKQLQRELLIDAKRRVDERRDVFNSENADQLMEILYYEELTKTKYDEFDLPLQFIGEAVQTIPLTGIVHYIAYAYDSQYVLELLNEELKSHVGEGKRIVPGTVNIERLVAHVIDYSDDISWIKITVDLSGTEQYILDPLSPWGAHFAKNVREMITGLGRQEAERIVKNLPEVESVDIRIWPPWNSSIPAIASQVSITPVSE